ncbi:recQ-mediated genome instability protein 1 isoform X2 [Mercurialis annua]|uniref:recQ-mediated genome instability protein 1 isoform X2 n=1 Tax=Mercurialis annua TaxID=3986 RepID=UPI00215FB202|nr:recQ-mediated genome instability protein 1 isoform X2 [Mercurialis annua]
MQRRRLRLNSYSDDDEEEERDHQNELHFNPPNPNPNCTLPAEPVTISDDEDDIFIDVADNLSSPSPPPEQQQVPPPHPPTEERPVPPPPPPVRHFSDCPISDHLLRLGLKLKREWLDSCLGQLDGNSIQNLDVEAKAKLCFQQFLFSDMNYSGGGLLPPNVDSMHLVNLAGPFILQVDEIVNISCPLKGRFQDAATGIKRCLKLSMTDGVQHIFGMEYRPIKDLQVLAPAGLKVVIFNVHIRHGLLMLVPEAVEVLGGMVDHLEEARQRLVEEVNKPPRGRRTRSGVVPPLTTRATLAAWPRDGVSPVGNTGSAADAFGCTNHSATSITRGGSTINDHGRTSSSVNINVHTYSSVNVHGQSNSSNVPGPRNSSTFQCAAPLQAEDQGADVVAPGNGISQRTTEEFAAPMSSVDTKPSSSSSVIFNDEEMHIDASFDRGNTITDQHYNVLSDHEDAHMLDEEHPIILTGDREKPFTYLASLSAKWAAMEERSSSVQGKIKCLLTGVKEFKFKLRTTYELQVYVDDGSLISEILIDHNSFYLSGGTEGNRSFS